MYNQADVSEDQRITQKKHHVHNLESWKRDMEREAAELNEKADAATDEQQLNVMKRRRNEKGREIRDLNQTLEREKEILSALKAQREQEQLRQEKEKEVSCKGCVVM